MFYFQDHFGLEDSASLVGWSYYDSQQDDVFQRVIAVLAEST